MSDDFTVELISNDGQSFTAPANLLMQSRQLSHTITDLFIDAEPIPEKKIIPLPNVNGEVLGRILKLCADREKGNVGEILPDKEMLRVSFYFIQSLSKSDLSCVSFVF